jgi:DNA invertase Pin-like site-specific DNA recombinase
MVVKTKTFWRASKKRVKKTWTLCFSSFIAAEKQGNFFIQVRLSSISMKQLTLINSGKMVALKEQGYSIRKVAEILKIPKSTVAHILKEYESEKSTDRRRGSGCSAVLGTEYKAVISEIVKN